MHGMMNMTSVAISTLVTPFFFIAISSFLSLTGFTHPGHRFTRCRGYVAMLLVFPLSRCYCALDVWARNPFYRCSKGQRGVRACVDTARIADRES